MDSAPAFPSPGTAPNQPHPPCRGCQVLGCAEASTRVWPAPLPQVRGVNTPKSKHQGRVGDGGGRCSVSPPAGTTPRRAQRRGCASDLAALSLLSGWNNLTQVIKQQDFSVATKEEKGPLRRRHSHCSGAGTSQAAEGKVVPSSGDRKGKGLEGGTSSTSRTAEASADRAGAAGQAGVSPTGRRRQELGNRDCERPHRLLQFL